MTDPSSPPPEKLTYSGAGVNIDAGHALIKRIAPLARTTARPGTEASLGGFGGLFDLKAAGFSDPVLVAATDGVGTKLKIAIETGRLDAVGIDLVAMCVNDLLAQGAEPLFFLDYFAAAELDVDRAAQVVAGIVEGCRQAGTALIGGETAEMPGMYAPGDFDLAGFAVGAAERGTLLPRTDIRAGDAVLGLASNGVHSNGFSLVRKVAARAGIGWNTPAPFAADMTLGEALLTPTRIYVKPLLPLIREGKIKALAHITGGGLPENVPRVLPDGIVLPLDADGWDWKNAPPVFGWLMKAGNIPPEEMLRTFNCGVGMVTICAGREAAEVSRTLESAGERIVQLGRLQNAPLAGDATDTEVRP